MTGMYDRICSEYETFSPRSRDSAVAARDVFPGGDTRSSAHFAPYPLFIERAEGARLHDADGHTLLDFMNNFTSLIHGHAHPDVVRAVREQVARGSAYAAPNSVPIDDSFPLSVLADTVVCPYNEPELAGRLIASHAHELAAVIVEPVLGSMGMVPATREFLSTLRQATLTHDIVLIFDEVITLRLGDLGAQQLHGVTPDLTAMGKIIGGFGGKRELMQRFHPDQPRPVMHASTFSGNPMSMAAGLAAMQQFNPQQRAHIHSLANVYAMASTRPSWTLESAARPSVSAV